jgi:hypothetical protein
MSTLSMMTSDKISMILKIINVVLSQDIHGDLMSYHNKFIEVCWPFDCNILYTTHFPFHGIHLSHFIRLP